MSIKKNNRTKCYTFYSYKGGSGRSTTAINTVNHLIKELNASPSHPILLIDADLESAGLTFYFKQEKKFKGCFNCTIHTTLLLAGPCNPADYFEKTSMTNKITKKLEDSFAKNFSDEKPSISEIFEGIKLTNTEWRVLENIVDSYNSFKATAVDNDIIKLYDITSLVSSLKQIHENTALSDEEKVQSKLSKLDAFLPSTAYSDISEYYGKEKGTVRFCGVDILYNGEQLAGNDATDQIKYLISECSSNNYAAIVFDSGAGTQSSAHAFHLVSDVLVYCMRPTTQFASGTRTNIGRYADDLRRIRSDYGRTSPNIVLLPTAVPQNDGFAPLRESCFNKIKYIAEDFSDIVDNSFCTQENALCEVGLFKWREQILGVCDSASDISSEASKISAMYAKPESMPEDAKKAYDTYEKLAKCIVKNSEDEQ